jgi:hypothetical protein
MAPKQVIIEHIGARGLALPDCIARGIAAYDRVKYYLALLLAAHAQAQAPEPAPPNLRERRESSGVPDVSLDRVVEESISRGNGTTYIPAACAILDAVFDNLRDLVTVVELASGVQPELRERSTLYRRRLDVLRATMQGCKDDQITSVTVSALTSQPRNGHDTIHHLTMDLQGELNRVQATVAAETIDGARAFGMTDADRVLVRAFMAGIHETSGLKFTHPGLNTTAARDEVRLSIQNDLGSTPEHVIVIHVDERVVTIAYTDVHRSRLRFLQGLLDAYTLTWTSTSTSERGPIVMTVGKYVADAATDIERFLRFVGSRLVFLIDWNRARKRLARLVSKGAAVDLLRWAADNNIGHRGFLEAGAIALIETAFERAFPMQTRFGVRLDELLGGQPARQFLMAVLRTSSWGVATGQSVRLIEDQIEAELLRHLETPEHHVLAGAAQHGATIVALTERMRQELARRRVSPDDAASDGQHGSQAAALAHTLTARADAVLKEQRRFIETHDEAHHLEPLFTEATGAATALEETAFLLPLIPPTVDLSLLTLLEALADHVGATARAYVRCLEEGQVLSRMSDRRDIDHFLMTIDRLAAVGREANGAKRALTERLLRGKTDCREFYALTTAAEGLECAASRLSRCGAIVRDEVLRSRLAR